MEIMKHAWRQISIQLKNTRILTKLQDSEEKKNLPEFSIVN